MKKVEDYWKDAWDNVSTIEEVYKSYGIRNVMQCFHFLLLYENKDSILDVGCGAGFYFKFFKSLGFKKLYGFEYDKGNIKKAEEINKGIMGLEIIQGDIRNLPNPFEENYFDVVISLGLVEHFVYPIDIIRKLLKTVKNGGALVLEMPNFRNWFYYSYNLKRKNELPFHLWWGVKEWCKILKRIKSCRLEKIQTGDFWAYRAYLPRAINKIFPKLLDTEIAIENKLFKKFGSLAFYKLRKITEKG